MTEDTEERLLGLLRQHDKEDKGAQQAAVITNIKAHTVIIHNGLKEPEKITEGQSKLMKSLVYQIGTEERARNPAYHDANTWTKANALVGVDHSRDIAKRDFNRVKAYLEGWLRRLQQ